MDYKPEITLRKPASGARILLLEEEAPLRRILADDLRAKGYTVETAGLADTARTPETLDKADAVLLGFSQWGVAERALLDAVRAEGRAPVLVVAPRKSEIDRRRIIQAGADDYVAKPVNVAQLSARIEALLYRPRRGADAAVYVSGSLVVDVARRLVTIRGVQGNLSEAEYVLLKSLAINDRQPLGPAELCRVAFGPGCRWGLDHLPELIQSLRRKIETDPLHPSHILTEPGVGFRLGVLESSSQGST